MEAELVLSKVFSFLNIHDKMSCKFVNKRWNTLLKHEKYHLTTYESDKTIQKWIDEVTPTLSCETFSDYWQVMDEMYKAYVMFYKNAYLDYLLHVHENYMKIDGTWYAKKQDRITARHEYTTFLRRNHAAIKRNYWREELCYQQSLAHEAVFRTSMTNSMSSIS